MLKILKRFLGGGERRKHGRVPVNTTVKFRILDGRNPANRTRLLEGKVLDMSAGGICIGTNTVQIDGLHIFHHPTSMYKNKLEIELELQPEGELLLTRADVSWYDRSDEEENTGCTYKVGVTWEALSRNERQTLEHFLARGRG